MRRLEAVQAHAMDAHEPGIRPFNGHAHVPEGLERGKAVLPLKEPGDIGDALRKGPQHDGPMGHGLVPGHPDVPLDRAARVGGVGYGLVGHGVEIGLTGKNSGKMLACRLGTGEHLLQALAVTGLDGLAELVQVLPEMAQRRQNRLAVGEKNVPPHHRVTGGNAREVPESAGGVTEDVLVVVLSGKRVHE